MQCIVSCKIASCENSLNGLTQSPTILISTAATVATLTGNFGIQSSTIGTELIIFPTGIVAKCTKCTIIQSSRQGRLEKTCGTDCDSSCPTSTGTVPVNRMLSESSSVVSFCKFPISLGMEPDNWLLESQIERSPCIFPISLGMVPDKVLPIRRS
eukprot:scaffold2756_cov105-Cylindrotheca_fusiformis.AAC.4